MMPQKTGRKEYELKISELQMEEHKWRRAEGMTHEANVGVIAEQKMLHAEEEIAE